MGLINGDESPIAIFPAAVTPEACAMLLDELATLPLGPGRVMADGAPVERHVQMAFLPHDHWSAAIMSGAVEQANEALGWRYELAAMESLQYSVYAPGDLHEWHMDTLSHGGLVRKLTVVVQLDDGADYEGGDLELLRFGVSNPEAIELPREQLRQRGTVLVFPSFLLHRVTPMMAGRRRTLVAWFVGPRFR